MHKIQSSARQENVKIARKCRCENNPNYARKNDRPALASIQREAAPGQYLSADYGQQVTGRRSKSVSDYLHAGPSKKPSSGPRQAPGAESTKIATILKAKPKATSTQLGPPKSVAVPSRHTSTSGKRAFSSTSGTVRSRSSQRASAGLAPSTSSHDDVFVRTPKAGCCAVIRSKSTKPEPPSLQSQQFVTLSQASSRTSVGSGYLTLPDEKFVTLSQDTLKTTRGSTADFALSKITFNRDGSIVDEDERTFVHARDFFHDLDQGKTSSVKTIAVRSPLVSNVPPRRGNSIAGAHDEGDAVVEKLKKPAVKMTLKKRNSLNKQAPFPLLYSPEYSNDLISYCYNHKGNLLLKSEWVKTFIDKRARSNTVNWLLQVSGFYAPQNEPVYYMSIRMFDYSIVALKLRHGHYQLAAIVAFWIALKYLDNPARLRVSKIFSLCNGKYSSREILSMERKMLKATHFCLNIPDPLDFLYNYLKASDLEDNEFLKYAVNFILECATLFETYALVEAPFIAATTLYMAYQMLRKTRDVQLNFIWYDKETIRHYIESVLRIKIRYAIVEKYEPVKKYGGFEKMHVAKMFFNV